MNNNCRQYQNIGSNHGLNVKHLSFNLLPSSLPLDHQCDNNCNRIWPLNGLWHPHFTGDPSTPSLNCSYCVFEATCWGVSVLQTYGGGNMKRVGVILQKSILILLLFCLPCWAVLINTHNLLLLMGQEQEVARYILQFWFL